MVPSEFGAAASAQRDGKNNLHLHRVKTYSCIGGGRTYLTSLKSSSLNFMSQTWISWVLSKFRACRKKKVVTRFKLSIASMQKANPPILSTSSSPVGCRTLVGVKLSVEGMGDRSAMPKYGVRTGVPTSQSVPSQGSLRFASAPVKLLFQLS